MVTARVVYSVAAVKLGSFLSKALPGVAYISSSSFYAISVRSLLGNECASAAIEGDPSQGTAPPPNIARLYRWEASRNRNSRPRLHGGSTWQQRA
eukprot:157778-Pyramimonas_sp.AAC.1